MLRTYMIGRSRFADIVLVDDTVAARHAELVVTDDCRYYLTDCATGRGTWCRLPDAGTAEAGWRQVRQGFVERHWLLRFGTHTCTLADLLADPPAAAVDEGSRASRRGEGEDGPQRLRGRIERDPLTGELVRKKL